MENNSLHREVQTFALHLFSVTESCLEGVEKVAKNSKEGKS